MLAIAIGSGYDHFTKWVDGIYSFLATAVTDALNILSTPIESGVLPSISAGINGIAYAVVGLLFAVEMLSVLLDKGEDLRWTDGIVVGMKAVISKEIVSWASLFMDAVFGLVTSAMPSTNAADSAELESQIMQIATGYNNGFEKDDGFANLVTNIVNFASCILPVSLVLITALLIMVMAYARGFELSVLKSLSPIAYSFLPFKGTQDIAKRYTLNFAGVCLQAIVMALCVYLYASYQKTLSGSYSAGDITMDDYKFKSLVYAILLVFGMISSGKWSKAVVGV